MSFDAMIAILFAAAFAVALGVRAWSNANQVAARRAACRRFRAQATATAARTPLHDRAVVGAGGYFAAHDEPIAYALTEKALTGHYAAAPRCNSTMPYRSIHGGQSW